MLHERRKPCARVVTAAGFGQKVLDVVSYHPVKRSSLGVAATVLRRKRTARSTRRALEDQWRAQGRRIAHDFGGYGWGGIHPPGYRLPAADVSSDLSEEHVVPVPWVLLMRRFVYYLSWGRSAIAVIRECSITSVFSANGAIRVRIRPAPARRHRAWPDSGPGVEPGDRKRICLP